MSSSQRPKLRSAAWFGRHDKYGFIARGWMRNQGIPTEMFDGRPVIGICNTWSELTPCNAHLRGLAEHVKRGVLRAGGLPLEFPVMSLGESLMRPTTMLFRNLASMDVEETLRANPLDGVVLLAGCDKTTPSLLMGAASVDLPTILVSGGPMLNGKFGGRDVGSGTDAIRLADDLKVGRIGLEEFLEAEIGMNRSAGSCMTMGTASTMASLCEGLGIALPHNGAIPAVDSRRAVLAEDAGVRIVELVEAGTPMSAIVTRAAFENAIVLNGAIGGSTNAVVHLLALAGRLGVDLTLADWDRLGRDVPCLVDLMPSGRFLMEDFFYAGGVPAVMQVLAGRLHHDAITVSGRTIGAIADTARIFNAEVIRPLDRPAKPLGGIAVLQGNLAPQGAVIKPSAAAPRLMSHRGRALVFDGILDFRSRIDDPDLDVDADSILVLKGAGPRGYPGMPEVGNLPLPKKLLAQGITDVVRISDARMSGTAFGTVVLHVAPEAAAGGPLALVETGDWITLDVPGRRLELHVDEATLASRRAAWTAPAAHFDRGYGALFLDHVLQADRGVDFDFLVGGSGTPTLMEPF
jgi:L-arabonate dehydrase